MPISLNPFLADNAGGIIGAGLVGAASQAITEAIAGVFDDIRSALDWGDDHIIEQDVYDSNGMVIDTFTISVPRLRNRPFENAHLSNTVLPGLFEASVGKIASGVSSIMASLVESAGGLFGRFS